MVYHDADGEIRLMKNHLYIFPMYRKYHITHNPQDPFQVLWMHLDCYHPITFKVVDVPIAAGSIEEKILCVLSAAMEERGEIAVTSFQRHCWTRWRIACLSHAAADERINRLLAMINQDTFISNENWPKAFPIRPGLYDTAVPKAYGKLRHSNMRSICGLIRRRNCSQKESG